MAVHKLKTIQTEIRFYNCWSKLGNYPYPAAVDHKITQNFL